MKTISIFGFPSHSPGKHTSGVDYPRLIQPLNFLNGYKDENVEIKVDLWDGKKIELKDWNLMVPKYDIVYFNYMINDWAFAAMGCMCRKHGVKMVMDLDDCLWQIGKDNTVYDNYKKGSKGINTITAICKEVDYITCTNNYLKNAIADNTKKPHDHIEVFPNCVDLKLYKHRSEFKDTPNIVITHYGSSSHYADLNEPEFLKAIDRIMYDYPNVTFLTVGSFFPVLKDKYGMRYEEEFGALDFKDWVNKRFPEVMDKTDIFVAPLTNNTYNKSKSDIKRSEVATAKIPFLGQDIRQYQECITNRVDGFLCSTADQWYFAIKILIDNPDIRKKVGESGLERVKTNRLCEQYVKQYAEFFQKVLTK